VRLDLHGHRVEPAGPFNAIDVIGNHVTVRGGEARTVSGAPVTVSGADARIVEMALSSGRLGVVGTGPRLSLLRSQISAVVPVRLEGDGHRVAYNRIAASSGEPSVAVSGDDVKVVGNGVSNLAPAVFAGGIAVDGAGARVARNWIAPALEAAISLSGEGGTITGNIALGIGGSGDLHGLVVRAGASGVLVRSNFAAGFGGDGIHVLAAGTALRRNVANDNGNLGIHAPGALDLGGNRAAGNGNPFACVGVRCG
jgi:hypothetical protein